MALPPYDPSFTMAFRIGGGTEIVNDQEHALKLDSVHTEYSAQYLVDNAGSHGHKLTVKGCLEFALYKGIPKAEDWPHLGSVSKPPSSYKPALVSMKGQVIEPKDIEEARDLLVHQPVGAKLHVFSPHLELQQDGIYCGSSGEPASYVGLRDGIILGVEKIYGKSIATVKVWYKRKFIILKVALSRMFYYNSRRAGQPRIIGPSGLLVDFCVPRLSID
ncbi:PREDICTED: uncharacterized protein LOC104751067 [Camelina sativa]|uniref:Uncharacterized protein LOC104751067 n=1 Tax=Camelina sativa TaxID=90675 RepID=A0ABM0WHR2_CAMSA|nr:PREDICTED: uncharacterized protein LOC104751067 [Camelina sativa]